MGLNFFVAIPAILIGLLFFGLAIYVLVLIIRALRRYLRSTQVKKEVFQAQRTLGETIREYRSRCKMTQEFVAESLGVSRQAVSKWESGASDPSTSNLFALAKLFGVSAEELLKGVCGPGNMEKTGES